MAAMNATNFMNTLASRQRTLAVMVGLGLASATVAFGKQPLFAPAAIEPTRDFVPATAQSQVPTGPLAQAPRALFSPIAYSSRQHSRFADPNTNWIVRNPAYNFYADRSLASGRTMGNTAGVDGLFGLGFLAAAGALVVGVKNKIFGKKNQQSPIMERLPARIDATADPEPAPEAADQRRFGNPANPDPLAVDGEDRTREFGLNGGRIGGAAATLEVPATANTLPPQTPAEGRQALRRAARSGNTAAAGTGIFGTDSTDPAGSRDALAPEKTSVVLGASAIPDSVAVNLAKIGTGGVSPKVVADMADTNAMASGESPAGDWDVDTGEFDPTSETGAAITLELDGEGEDSWDVGEAGTECPTLELKVNPAIAKAAGLPADVSDEATAATHPVLAPVAPAVTGGDDGEEVTVKINEVSGAGADADGEGSDHENEAQDFQILQYLVNQRKREWQSLDLSNPVVVKLIQTEAESWMKTYQDLLATKPEVTNFGLGQSILQAINASSQLHERMMTWLESLDFVKKFSGMTPVECEVLAEYYLMELAEIAQSPAFRLIVKNKKQFLEIRACLEIIVTQRNWENELDRIVTNYFKRSVHRRGREAGRALARLNALKKDITDLISRRPWNTHLFENPKFIDLESSIADLIGKIDDAVAILKRLELNRKP